MSDKIPHYVNNPVINRMTAPENKLIRPQIHFARAFCIMVATIVATMLISYGVSIVLRNSSETKLENISQLRFWFSIYVRIQLVILLLTLRYIFIWFIRIYQRYAKSETRLRCCFTPSCSEYAILALKKYGLLIGCYKAANRLLRCGPPGGVDYP